MGRHIDLHLGRIKGDPHNPLSWIGPVLLATFLANAVVQVWIGAWMNMEYRTPAASIWIVPCVSLVLGVLAIAGLHNRRRWAWILAMLVFSSLFLGTIVVLASLFRRESGLALFGILCVTVGWGLPAFFLYRVRRVFFAHAAEE